MDSQKVAEFISVTGAEYEVARHMLEANAWNVEQAIGLFFESGAPKDALPQNVPDAFPIQEEEVRAPILDLKDDQLIDPAKSSAFSKHESKPVQDAFHAKGEKRTSGLSQLFAPPPYALKASKCQLSDALEKAEGNNQWLVAYVIDGTDFQSQTLNRDVFSSDAMVSTAPGFFTLWQCYTDEPAGETFMQQYKVTEIPFVGILDPRTGECVSRIDLKRWKAEDGHSFSSERAIDQIMGFIDRHDGFAPPTKKVAPPTVSEPPPPSEPVAPPPTASPETAEWTPPPSVAKYVSDSGSVKLRWRLADGNMIERSLLPEAPLSVLYDVVRCELEASRTRPFQLKAGFPPRVIECTDSETVQQRQLSNEMLNMSYTD
eukprot:Sspe_Gene.44318::Locus_21720_Transcript_1_1_Confidence_1.000_Length_1231::g.44318::m.44318